MQRTRITSLRISVVIISTRENLHSGIARVIFEKHRCRINRARIVSQSNVAIKI